MARQIPEIRRVLSGRRQDRTQRYRIDAHHRRQRFGGSQRECIDRPLGKRVREVLRIRPGGSPVGHVDDGALDAVRERTGKGLGEEHRGPQIHPEGPIEVFRTDVQEGVFREHCSAVDQNPHRGEVGCAGDDVGSESGIGEIGTDQPDLASHRPGLFGRVFGGGGGPVVVEHQVAPGLGEGEPDRPPHPMSTTCHESGHTL